MLRFAANLTWMFNEWPLPDRFAAAADSGFTAVEILFPYDHPASEVAGHLQRHKLTGALFNVPAGDFAAGERGFAVLPERFDDLKASVTRAVAYARETGVTRLHLMAGLADSADPRAADAFCKSVSWSADVMARHGIALMLEPINSRDMPGYFLNDFGLAERLIRRLAHPNVHLQFDIYHRQIIHGDVVTGLRQFMPLTGHIQIAGVPSRNEPDSGELNYPFLFGEIDRLGYGGFIGCEYRPRTTTVEGLDWWRSQQRMAHNAPVSR
jgi:hydroxypyruvate isomerase